jgi:hypothetical protein
VTESPSRPVRLWNYRYALFCSLISLAFLAVALAGMLDPANPETTDSPLWAIALFGLLAFLGIRPWFLGLSVHDTFVVRRGWLKSERYELADIKKVGSTNYGGYWNRFGDSTTFAMVELRFEDDEVAIPELAGRNRTAQELADRVTGLLERRR